MMVEFSKMNGAGNDFVLIDNRLHSIRMSHAEVTKLCDRQKGVGADGVLLLIPADSGRADWAWEFYNRDGSKADMCGNGARCFARYVQRLTDKREGFTFETGAGIIKATFQGEKVTVSLTTPRELRLNEEVALSIGPTVIHSLNTGVPHAVMFVPDVDQAMVQALGPEVRRHPHFAPQGTNVNFVELAGPNFIRVRTFERGVEGETLACGTGVTASALISARIHRFTPPVKVGVHSGETLEVAFDEGDGGFKEVQLSGAADFVFDGRIEL